jgi:hypothetical protein
MLSIGIHLGGPEGRHSAIDRLLTRFAICVTRARGEFTVGDAPAINVVFYVPGSLLGQDEGGMRAGRLSRRQKLVLVAVPICAEMAASGGTIKFVAEALHQSVEIGAAAFAKNGIQFDVKRAVAIIKAARSMVLENDGHA